MGKIKVGILGTGNIGTDLLVKLQRSNILECGMFAGRNSYSRGIKLAEKMKVPTSIESINTFIKNPSCCDIVFDATSASVHMINEPILKELGKFTIDLTPARINPMCVPVINLEQCINGSGVNLITCGGQATVPIAYVLSKIHPEMKYLEVVASIASKSAGPGTRNNIDEFTQTTREALNKFTKVENTKAIIILNPADPPIIMRNTIYALIKNPDMKTIVEQVSNMANEIKKYVPGYRVILGPIHEDGRVTTTVEVVGLGDYLPSYSGNLDIITCAAIKIAEEYAIKKLLNRGAEW